MRFLLILFIALSAGIGLTILAENPGYVLIMREPWSIETSVMMFILALFISFIIFYLLIRLLNKLISAPEGVRRWQRLRSKDQAIEYTRKGLVETIKGNWTLAEKLLTKKLEDNPLAELNLLSAAWNAQQEEDFQKRDDYLDEASKLGSPPSDDTEMAIGIAQCTMQHLAGQTEQALATARSLSEVTPTNPAIMRSLIKLLAQTEQWQELLSVIASTSRHHPLNENDLSTIQTLAATKLLASSNNISDLEQNWQILPRSSHKQVTVIASYCRTLLLFDKHNEAETQLRSALKKQWSEELIEIYGQVKTDDPGAQLKYAESLLADHPTDSQLMLCMGRLAIQNQLWGMARSFLEVAVQNGDNDDAFLELARLHESLDETDSALKIYKRGLENSLNKQAQDLTLQQNPALESQHKELKTQTPSLAYSNESK
jgi:HemY protein